MKKLFIMAIASISLLLIPNSFAADNDIIKVINSQENILLYANDMAIGFPDAKPFIDENDRTQVPVRAVAEMLDCKVDWNGETQTVTITKNGEVITLVIGEDVMSKNGEQIQMDTKAMIKDERTYIPVRFIAEAMDYQVSYFTDLGGVALVNGEISDKYTVNPHLSFDGSEDWNIVGEANYRDYDFYSGNNIPSDILSKFEKSSYDMESEIVDLAKNGLKEHFVIPITDQMYMPESRVFKNANDVYVRLTPSKDNAEAEISAYFKRNVLFHYQKNLSSVFYAQPKKISTTEVSVFHFKDVGIGDEYLCSIGAAIDFENEYSFTLEVVGE